MQESLNIIFTIIYLFREKKSKLLLQVLFLQSSIESNEIELMRLCGVLQSNFLCLSQSESRIQPCHVRIYGKYFNAIQHTDVKRNEDEV